MFYPYVYRVYEIPFLSLDFSVISSREFGGRAACTRAIEFLRLESRESAVNAFIRSIRFPSLHLSFPPSLLLFPVHSP